ncbi:MAG: histidine kinase dimerization/phosphoacceptor domain-containing protein, partial [Paracoccaceae bacterium]|nr:histidine kinase dimerization/phosphoacceptor domain-containing protein [Paracoccaceae bacterium]
DRTGMVSIGNIYFGNEENFYYPHLKNIFYYETYRTAMLGAQIILLMLLIGAFLTKGLGSEAIPPIVILIFFVLLGSAIFPDLIPNLLEINQLTIAMAPAVVVVLLNFFYSIYYENIYKNYTFLLYGILLFVIVVFMLTWTGAIELISYNAFVSAPSLIGGLTLLSLTSVFLFMKSQRMEIGLWAISSTLMVFSLGYDMMFRFGVLDTGAATVTLSSSVFVIILSAMFVNTILRTKNQLSQANNMLIASLDKQSRQLEAEFASSAKLVRDAAIASEKARLMQELHDGVLTYLGIVSVLSEDGSDKTMQKINQLSRYASNEIRVILEARPSDQNSLTIALG